MKHQTINTITLVVLGAWMAVSSHQVKDQAEQDVLTSEAMLETAIAVKNISESNAVRDEAITNMGEFRDNVNTTHESIAVFIMTIAKEAERNRELHRQIVMEINMLRDAGSRNSKLADAGGA